MDITRFYNWMFPEPMTINFWALIIVVTGFVTFIFIALKLTDFITKWFSQTHRKTK